jgi:2-aminoadipate transaminase
MESFSLLIKSFPRVCQIATDAMTYDRVLSDIVTQGHQAVGVAMTDEGVDLTSLEQTLKEGDIKVFYQVAYHHNPTGITTTYENLESAAQLCASHGVLHCLDVAYYELRYDGEVNRLVELDKYPDTSCLVGSFTKTLSPGAKCGFGIFPEAIVKQMTPVVADTRLNPNYPTQAAINQLFESGFYDRHLASLIELYKPRMDAMNEGIETLLPDLGTPHLNGGFFQGLWLAGLSEEQPFLESLKAKGVLLAPANVFAPGWKERLYAEKSGVFFRLTFPALSVEENTKGIELIAETYKEMI